MAATDPVSARPRDVSTRPWQRMMLSYEPRAPDEHQTGEL
jgi:hypothetical protein